ncbi:cation transporter [Marinilabiliaceae bacterium JC017]|nr:cation transporter [Marinilabiliaceae bacterium JC017]
MHGKKLLWVTLLNLSITLVQLVGGVISNSLALLSDALHNLGDSSAIFIAFIANKIGRRNASDKNTFGYKRFEIVAAFFNAIVLIAICIFLFYEAYRRFMNPEPIKGMVMLWVAGFGLVANLLSVLVLQKEKEHNLNMKAAYLHLLGDTLSSVAVIAGGVFMVVYQVYWIDPLITVLVGVYIIYHTWHVLKESFDILMQGTPPGIKLGEIQESLEQLAEIKDIHHVHVWRLGDSQLFFEGHVNISNDLPVSASQRLIKRIEAILKEEFSFSHVTLQMEYNGCQANNGLIYRNTHENHQ